MTHALRPATPDDYAALAELQRRSVDACLRPLYDAGPIDAWIESLDAAKFRRVAATGEEIVLAEVEGEAAGFVSFHAEMQALGMWYVHPTYIGQGIGASLLRFAEARLAEEGCSEATTEASLFARPHFESLGWKAGEEFDKAAFGGHFRVTRMSKAL